MINVVLIEPEIPQNTGNVARTCACAGAILHLVEPMGFRLTDHRLKRAGCDYWGSVEVVRWACAEAFFSFHDKDELYLFTGCARQLYTERDYGKDAYLIFGRESRGLDASLLQHYEQSCVRIPMGKDKRSLNLSNAVAIGLYEAMRQQGFPGLS